jgi:hypothetical protein
MLLIPTHIILSPQKQDKKKVLPLSIVLKLAVVDKRGRAESTTKVWDTV